MILPFGLGLLWMALTGVQVKLQVKTGSEVLLFAWVALTSLVWGWLVRAVAMDSQAIIPYALGTACGAILARKLVERVRW
jgi:hypothetical protein